MGEATTGIDIDKRGGRSLWTVLRQAPDVLRQALRESGEGTEESRGEVLDRAGLLVAGVANKLRKSRSVHRNLHGFEDNDSDDPNASIRSRRFSVRVSHGGEQAIFTCLWRNGKYDRLTVEERLPVSIGESEDGYLVKITTLTPEGITCFWGEHWEEQYPAHKPSLGAIIKKVGIMLEPIRSHPPESTEMITEQFPRPRET
ncbi:MAG: hypothetical protein Q8N98_02070 [bacterium]|nr:hypothetical protein [bacterium]